MTTDKIIERLGEGSRGDDRLTDVLRHFSSQLLGAATQADDEGAHDGRHRQVVMPIVTAVQVAVAMEEAAQAIEARSDETAQHGSARQGESAVAESDAPGPPSPPTEETKG